MEERGGTQRIIVATQAGKTSLGALNVDEIIILKFLYRGKIRRKNIPGSPKRG
jgi:hypothetical protein